MGPVIRRCPRRGSAKVRTGKETGDERDERTEWRKKRYIIPRLVSHGDVGEKTLRGGADNTDVPIGTPVDGNIGNAAS